MYWLILLFCASFSSLTHDIHLSKSLVEYNAESKSIQISMHIYLDDLEAILNQRGAPERLNLCTEKEHPEGEQHLIEYLRDQFKVSVNGAVKPFAFVGKEISEDYLAAWCYLEIEQVPSIQVISIKNKVLMDLYDDQKNIVQVVMPNKRKAYFMFDRKQNEETIKF